MNWFTSLALLGLFAFGSSHICDKEAVEPCFDNLTYYDERQFPSRGVGEHQLEKICTNLNESFDCVEYFSSVCNSNSDCDEKCQTLVNKMKHFMDESGVREVRDALCDYENKLRHAYLKDPECLNKQMDEFDNCRDIWEQSEIFIGNIELPDERFKKLCCAATFYKVCIINATQGICDEEATNVVRYIFDSLFWQHIPQKCDAFPPCDKPLAIPRSSSSPSAKPYSSWLFMYFIFMFLSVLVIKH